MLALPVHRSSFCLCGGSSFDAVCFYIYTVKIKRRSTGGIEGAPAGVRRVLSNAKVARNRLLSGVAAGFRRRLRGVWIKTTEFGQEENSRR